MAGDRARAHGDLLFNGQRFCLEGWKVLEVGVGMSRPHCGWSSCLRTVHLQMVNVVKLFYHIFIFYLLIFLNYSLPGDIL